MTFELGFKERVTQMIKVCEGTFHTGEKGFNGATRTNVEETVLFGLMHLYGS